MQKNCKIFQLIVKKMTTPETEEPEVVILPELCGKHLIDFHPLLGNVHVAFCQRCENWIYRLHDGHIQRIDFF